jgi:hypothetical protein
VTSTEYSWPTVIGVEIVLCAHRVPIEDTDVGAADAGLVHLHQHIVGADLGLLLGDGRLNILAGLLLGQPHAP